MNFRKALGLGPAEHVVQAMGDVRGGVVLVVEKQATDSAEAATQAKWGRPVSLVRVGMTAQDPSWRFDLGTSFTTSYFARALTQTPDGTIFTLNGNIVAIDGTTGQVKFQVAPPPSYDHIRNIAWSGQDGVPPGLACPQYNSDAAGGVGWFSLSVDASGRLNAVTGTQDRTTTYGNVYTNCTQQYGPFIPLGIEKTVQVLLYQVAPSGSYDVIQLHDEASANDYPRFSSPYQTGVFPSALPDDQGGVLAYWALCRQQGDCPIRGKYVKDGSMGTEYALAGVPSISGSDQLAYVGTDAFGNGASSVTALRMTDGAVVWSAPVTGQPIAALDGGGVAIGRIGSATTILDSNGSVTETSNAGFFDAANTVYAASPLVFGGDSWIGWSGQNGDQFGAVASSSAPLNLASFATPFGGDGQRTNALRRFADLDTAVLSALRFVWPWATDWEWGGLICRQGDEYLWSRLVTSHDAGSVNVLGQTSCAPYGTAVADYHAHTPDGQTTPSTFGVASDINTANAHQELFFYLAAPTANHQGPEPAFIRYQGPDAIHNIWYWINGQWRQ